MEINKLQEVNPDDLDTIFRGIQYFIEQKQHDLEAIIPQLIDKYKSYQLQDHDRRLFHRFYIRVSELLEKCRNQTSINYILGIRDLLSYYKASNFAVILSKVQKRSQCQPIPLNDEEIVIAQPRKITPVTPTWQINSQVNKALFQYYDTDFWKLYDIMLLNRQYCSNLIVYHQSKQENVERLFQLSLERNQRLIQSHSCPQIETSFLLQKAQQLKLQLHQTLDTPYHDKNIIMFGNTSPNKRQFQTQPGGRQSISISPQRAHSRDTNIDTEFKNIFDQENSNIFDSNFRVTRTKNLSLHNNDKNGTIIQTIKQRTKQKLIQQENFSPSRCKNQNWVLPEIKSPFQIDINNNDSIIKPIQIIQQSPERKSAKKPPLGCDMNSSFCQQLLLQFKNNTRQFQTIRSVIRK